MHPHTCVYLYLRLNKKKDNDIKWNVFIYKQWDKNGKESLLSQVYIIINKKKRNAYKKCW